MTTEVLVLQRAPFMPIEVAEGWDKSLLAEAASLIGYRPRALQEAEGLRQRNLNEVILARVLEDLAIWPFTIRSVEAYKALRLRETLKKQSHWLTRYMHHSGERRMEKGETVVHTLGILSWVATSIMGIGVAIGSCEGHLGSLGALGLMGLPLLGLGTWAFLMALRHKKATAIQANWVLQSVGPCAYHPRQRSCECTYQEAIPAFAVQRMVSLKKALPEITFSVERLQVTREDLKTQKSQPIPADPFLVATYEGISCYVDVWDEPAFEGRRQF